MFFGKLWPKYHLLVPKTNVCYKSGNIKLTLARKNSGLPLTCSGINKYTYGFLMYIFY